MNKKILIITYYWPPSGGVGVQRWMNYAIQLKKKGWEPIIYTPENPQFELKDFGLLDTVKDIRVVKTKIWEPFNFFHKITGNKNKNNIQQGLVMEKTKKGITDRIVVWLRGNLFVPDPRAFWVAPSIKFLTKFIREEEINTIITTGPPHSMHLIGLKLQASLAIKWLADFRDPWSEWDVLDKLKINQLTRWRHRRLEKKVLSNANRVLTVSERMMLSLGGLGAKDRIEVQYNGVSAKVNTPKAKEDKLVIGYYGMLNEMRNPSELWKLLSSISTNIELRLGGIVSASIVNEISQFKDLKERTHFLGYLSHEEIQSEYAKCDVLLLLLNRTENAKWILPVKFFEYLAATRRILALGPPDSDLAELAKDVSSFTMFRYDDNNSIENFLVSENVEVEFSSGASLLETFTHANLAAKLSKTLEQLHG